MADTIREKIIKAIATKLGTIRTANGYVTEIGTKVDRGLTLDDPDNLPRIAMFPGREEANKITRAYVCSMNVRVLALFAADDSNPSELSEKALGDLVKCVCGEVGVGAELTLDGALTGAAVTSVLVNEAIPAGVAASGKIRIQRADKTYSIHAYTSWTSKTFTIASYDFSANNAPDNGHVTVINSAIESTTNGYADEIIYLSGGVESWPEPQAKILGVPTEFTIKYRIAIGDPYNQP